MSTNVIASHLPETGDIENRRRQLVPDSQAVNSQCIVDVYDRQSSKHGHDSSTPHKTTVRTHVTGCESQQRNKGYIQSKYVQCLQ